MSTVAQHIRDIAIDVCVEFWNDYWPWIIVFLVIWVPLLVFEIWDAPRRLRRKDAEFRQRIIDDKRRAEEYRSRCYQFLQQRIAAQMTELRLDEAYTIESVGKWGPNERVALENLLGRYPNCRNCQFELTEETARYLPGQMPSYYLNRHSFGRIHSAGIKDGPPFLCVDCMRLQQVNYCYEYELEELDQKMDGWHDLRVREDGTLYFLPRARS